MSTCVHYQVSERIAEITLDRPEKRNALNPQLIAELSAAFKQAETDQEVKVIVLKAKGEVFSAGADLAYLHQLQKNTFKENLADSQTLRMLYEQIRHLPKVVIAQLEGHAIAGGCGLACICDIIFAVPEAKLGYTEVKLGFLPAIVSCYLQLKIGESATKHLLLSGELISTEEALQYKMINFVTAADKIGQTVRNYALNLCNQTSAESIAATKKLLNQYHNNWLNICLDHAVLANAKIRESDDFKRGIAAFLNKEKINW